MRKYLVLDQIIEKPDQTEWTEEDLDLFQNRYLDFIEGYEYFSSGMFIPQTEEELLED